MTIGLVIGKKFTIAQIAQVLRISYYSVRYHMRKRSMAVKDKYSHISNRNLTRRVVEMLSENRRLGKLNLLHDSITMKIKIMNE